MKQLQRIDKLAEAQDFAGVPGVEKQMFEIAGLDFQVNRLQKLAYMQLKFLR